MQNTQLITLLGLALAAYGAVLPRDDTQVGCTPGPVVLNAHDQDWTQAALGQFCDHPWDIGNLYALSGTTLTYVCDYGGVKNDVPATCSSKTLQVARAAIDAKCGKQMAGWWHGYDSRSGLEITYGFDNSTNKWCQNAPSTDSENIGDYFKTS
jgi:hypothetical protein